MSSCIARVVALALAVAIICSRPPTAKANEQRGGPVAQVRGLWVLRSSLASPRSIAGVVRTAVAGGYNTLLVQVRGRGDAYYKSPIEPRASELGAQSAAFDPLRTMLTTAHAAGLKVHAWFNVNLVSSAVTRPQSREHVTVRHPEWLMVPRAIAPELHRLNPATPAYVERLARWTRGQSDTVEGLYLSPITDGAQAYTVSVARSLAATYNIDGIHLDYSRYPTADFDYSTASLNAFRSAQLTMTRPDEQIRVDRALRTDPLAWTRAYPEAWVDFRLDRLTTLIRRIRDAVKNARPGATLSSAVLPDPAEARNEHMQDWERWASSNLLDVFCPMAYASEAPVFSDQLAKAMAARHGHPIWIGIGAWRLPVEQTAARLTMVHRTGVAGVLLFSYDSLRTAGSPNGSYFARLRPTLLNPSGKPAPVAEVR